MNKETLTLKIQQLLTHSVMEREFYDRATDIISSSELKSAFAKYLWMRGEHIVGIKTFLMRAEQNHEIPVSQPFENERLWRFFIESVKRRDNSAILNTGMRYARLTRYKYNTALPFANMTDRLNTMLQNHLFEIQNILQEFSSIQLYKTRS